MAETAVSSALLDWAQWGSIKPNASSSSALESATAVWDKVKASMAGLPEKVAVLLGQHSHVHGATPPSSPTSAGTPDREAAGPEQEASRDSAAAGDSAFALPKDVMLQVFSFLTPRDLLLTAAPVCRAWRGMALSPAVWTPRLAPALAQASIESSTAASANHQPQASGTQHGSSVGAQHGAGNTIVPLPLPHSLYLAAHQFNLLRNPRLLKHLNTDTLALSKWRRNAWVVTSPDSKDVLWISSDGATPQVPAAVGSGSNSSFAAALKSITDADDDDNLATEPPASPSAFSRACWSSSPTSSAAATAVTTSATGSSSAADTAASLAFPCSVVAPAPGVAPRPSTAPAVPAPLAYPSGTCHGAPEEEGNRDLAHRVTADLAQRVTAGFRGLVRAAATTAGAAGTDALGCIGTQMVWGEVTQVVDLVSELQQRGLSQRQAEALLDRGLPLGLSLMVASGTCPFGGLFAVALLLDSERGDSSPPAAQAFIVRPGRHHYYSGYKGIPAGGQWHRFSALVPEVPPGCRRAMVILRGRASHSGDLAPQTLSTRPPAAAPAGRGGVMPAGVYGTRFASAQLAFVAPQQAELYNECQQRQQREVFRDV